MRGAYAKVDARPAARPLDILSFDLDPEMAPKSLLGIMRCPVAFSVTDAPQPLISLLQRRTC
jgi:hypothetical protein